MKKARVRVVRYEDRQNLALRFRCPVTGRQKQRSAGTSSWSEATGLAKEWEAELNDGGYQPTVAVPWHRFRRDFTDNYLSDLRESSTRNYACAFDDFERICNPGDIADISSDLLKLFRRGLRAEGRRGHALEWRLACVLRALKWAYEEELLQRELVYDAV